MSKTDPMALLGAKLSGRFIVLDGPDGGGKSTQLATLADRLTRTGLEVCRLRDPGGTTIGDRIRDILLDRSHDGMGVECEMLLYMASRAQLVHQRVRPALARGACVLCDRFVAATVAYQGAGGLDARTILNVARAAVGETWPNLTIILDIDSAAGLARLTADPDRMEAKALSFHQEVRRRFLQQAAADPARFAVVDADGSIDSTHQAIVAALAEWVDRRGL